MLEDMPDVEVLDLLDSMRLPQLRSVLMETLSDRFMRQIAFSLFQRMRHSVSLLSCINGVMSHESAMSSLPEVMLAGIADLAPLRGRMLVAIDGDLIGAVVDALCGATSAQPFERYELSAMETRIGRQIIDLTLREISEGLNGLMHLELTPISFENASGMLAIADGQDWMIVCTGIFDTALGMGTIKIVAPYAALEPLEIKINSQSGIIAQRGSDTRWISSVEQMAEDTPVDLRFELARAPVPVAVFEALRIGDILPVLLQPDAQAVCGGVDLFRAEYGQFDGFVCVRVKSDHAHEGDLGMADQKTGAEGERVELERLVNQPRGGPVITAKGALDKVQVIVTVELGRTSITVKDLRQLRHGQVITLDQMVGESLAIFANGQKLAYGEVVAVPNDKYGVRVTGLADDAEVAAEDAA
jgi:flagellar motor switch protein FliM